MESNIEGASEVQEFIGLLILAAIGGLGRWLAEEDLDKIGPWAMGLGWVITTAAVSMASFIAGASISKSSTALRASALYCGVEATAILGIAFGVPLFLGVFGITAAKQLGRAPEWPPAMGLFVLLSVLELSWIRYSGLPLGWAIAIALWAPLVLGGVGIGAAIQRRCVQQWIPEIGLFFLGFLGLEFLSLGMIATGCP